MDAGGANLLPLPLNPTLFEVRASTLCGDGTFERATSAFLTDLRGLGVDILYILGVWTTGWAGHAHSVAVLREQHRDPALASSSPLTILTYDVDERFGGNVALVNLRLRAHAVGLRVVVDFVVNHMARDHAWTRQRPWMCRSGTDAEAARWPGSYYLAPMPLALGAGIWLAHGRDSGGDTKADTVQLDFYHPELRRAMIDILIAIATSGIADGVRCDMAMLALNDVIRSTWGDPPSRLRGAPPGYDDGLAVVAPERVAVIATRAAPADGVDRPASNGSGRSSDSSLTEGLSEPSAPSSPIPTSPFALPATASISPDVGVEFWKVATLRTRAVAPAFLFIGEGLGGAGQQLDLGFDWVYDSELFYCVWRSEAAAVRAHLASAPQSHPARLARYVETHAGDRALMATVPPHLLTLLADSAERQQAAFAAAVLVLCAPGLRCLHDRQAEGRFLRHSMHEGPRRAEPTRLAIRASCRRLLAVLAEPAFKLGTWLLGLVAPARHDNGSHDSIIAYFATPPAPPPLPRQRLSRGWAEEGADVPDAGAPLPGRTFLVLVNFRDVHAEGHVRFDPHVTADAAPDVQHAALHVASLCSGARAPSGVSFARLRGDEHSLESGGSAPQVRRLGFADHLSSMTHVADAATVAADGWRARLTPCAAHVFEVMQLHDA